MKTAPEVPVAKRVFGRRFKKIPPSRYSPTQEMCSTIAEAGLNFRVRNGNGCGPRSMDGGKTLSLFPVPLISRTASHDYHYQSLSIRIDRSLNSEYLSELERLARVDIVSFSSFSGIGRPNQLVKPHGRLVSVSSTHYCASTSDLSNSWSWSALKEPKLREISS